MKNSRLIALLYGWIVILGCMLVASFILSLILRFTTIGASTLSWVTLSVSVSILFIGGLTAGLKGKEKGWIMGGSTGLGFILFVLLYQYLGYQSTISLDQVVHHSGFLVASLIGGILGVNLSNGSDQQ